MTGKLYSQIEHEKLSGQNISVNGVLKKLGLSKSRISVQKIQTNSGVQTSRT